MDPHSVVLDMFLDDDMSSCSYNSFTSGSPYYPPPSPQPVFSHLLSDVSESSSDDDLIHKLSNDLELPLSMDEFDCISGGIWSSNIDNSNTIKSPWSSDSTSSFTSQESVKRENGCDLIAEELTRQLYPNLISEAESLVTSATTTVLKQEPNSPEHFLNSPSPPRSDNGDDLWELLLNSTGDVKPNIKILDTITPPVSPPLSDGSPPHSPQPPDPSPPMTKTFILQPSQARINNRNNSQSNQPIKVVTITTRNNISGATKGGRISKTTKIQPKVITSSSQPQVISIVNSVNSAKVALPKSAGITGVSNSNNSTSRIVQLKAPVRVQQQRPHTTQVTPIITHSSNSSSPATHGLTNAIISHTIGGQPTVLTTNTQNGSSSLAPLAPALQPGLKNDNLPDMKAFKRQQRMIKNRESASLSRKKKKEYVTTLEGQLSDMDKDNCRLKEENTRLHQRISSLESELTSLRQSIGRGPSRKATTALFAVMLFAMLNMAPLTGVLLSSSESRLDTMKSLVPGGKTSSAEVPKFHQRSLLWTEELSESSVFENGSDSNSTSSMCPMSMNATESLRVKTQLQGWFERKTGKSSGNLNQPPILPAASPPPPPPPHPKTREGRKNIFSTVGKLNTIPQIQNEKIVQLKESMHALTARAAAVPSNSGVLHGNGAPSTRMYSYLHADALHVDPSRSVGEDTSVVDVPRFGSFLDAIQRRDDTYYVVSFSSDQVLIPASSRNDSSRPRMSLLLPTAPLNGSLTPPPQHIAMMQIDCEVTYTKLVHISEDLVPLGMRNKPTNVSHSTPRHGSSASIKRERKNYKSRSLFSPHKEQDPSK